MVGTAETVMGSMPLQGWMREILRIQKEVFSKSQKVLILNPIITKDLNREKGLIVHLFYVIARYPTQSRQEKTNLLQLHQKPTEGKPR